MPAGPMVYRHIPVMLKEAVALLNCAPGKILVDGTLGGSGHAQAILERIMPGGLLIGIDQDSDAIRHAQSVLKPWRQNVRLVHDNFANLPSILAELDLSAVDGILIDLGLSLHQLEGSGRGFSFSRNEPLDMRMNADSGTTAEELIRRADETELARIFREYGEERWADRIARAIVRQQARHPITSSLELAEVITEAVPKSSRVKSRIHPATRVFMALRIAVNRELERLDAFLDVAVDLLRPAGRICILAFHSLEDRIVKHRLRQYARGCTCPPKLPRCVCQNVPRIRILTGKALRPSEAEIRANPMARSTRLRAAEKLV